MRAIFTMLDLTRKLMLIAALTGIASLVGCANRQSNIPNNLSHKYGLIVAESRLNDMPAYVVQYGDGRYETIYMESDRFNAGDEYIPEYCSE